MKKIILLLPMLLLFGCNESENVKMNFSSVTSDHKGVKINGVGVGNFVIDSCEYIGQVNGWNNDWLTHKGNCKYCIERVKNNCK
jgi:hypothetical protein